MEKTKLYLASSSPRRQELLTLAGVRFKVMVAHQHEEFPETLQVHEVPEFLATYKALEVAKHVEDGATVLAADTVVVVDNSILGKPVDAHHAMEMLQRLSGRTHEVLTGVCIWQKDRRHSFTDTTRVTFRPLNPAKINHYIQVFKPFDKAGSYAIQEWIGLVGIKRISGDFFNVMGLPVGKVIEVLEHWHALE